MGVITIHIRTMLLFTALIIGVISVSEAQKNDVLFDQGTKHYAAEKYQEAINSWKLIEKTQNESPELYYNLGNAYYKMNKVAPSIYYFEKALQLAPNDADIKNNLGFAQNARVDAIEALPKGFIAKAFSRLYSIATFETWAKIAVMCAILAVTCFLLYYFVVSSSKKRIYLVTSLAAFLFLLLSLALAYATYDNIMIKHPAIIFETEVAVMKEASLGSETQFKLHEGTKVEITETQENWAHILLANGATGWIPLDTLKKL